LHAKRVARGTGSNGTGENYLPPRPIRQAVLPGQSNVSATMKKYLLTGAVALLLGILIGMVLQSERGTVGAVVASTGEKIRSRVNLRDFWRGRSEPPYTRSVDMVARFSDGTAVQLLAIGEYKTGPSVKPSDVDWWLPDGTPLDKCPAGDFRSYGFTTSGTHWLLFRTAGVVEPKMSVISESAKKTNQWGPSTIRGRSGHLVHYITYTADYGGRTSHDALRLTYASDGWTTEAVFEASNPLGNEPVRVGNYALHCLGPVYPRALMQVTYAGKDPLTIEGKDFKLHYQLLGETSDGEVLEAITTGWSESKGRPDFGIHYQFDAMPPERFRRFVFVKRHIETATFQGVALQADVSRRGTGANKVHLVQAPETLVPKAEKIMAPLTVEILPVVRSFPAVYTTEMHKHQIRVEAIAVDGATSKTVATRYLPAGSYQQLPLKLPVGSYHVRATSGTRVVEAEAPVQVEPEAYNQFLNLKFD